MPGYIHRFLLLGVISIQIISCNNKSGETDQPVKDSTPVVNIKKDSSAGDVPSSPPIINITDTLIKKQFILYVKDSAATSEGVNKKLALIYKQTLPQIVNDNDIEILSPPIAWFTSQGSPFFFEAGFTVSASPKKKLPAKVKIKTIGGDSAVVAHFYGPYELLSSGYEALKDWMKSNNKKAAGKPYEIYVTDPFTISPDKKNLYRTRTDIFIPHK